MGFVVPAAAALGAAVLGAAGSAAAGAGVTAAVGAATAASVGVGIAGGVKSLVSKPPQPPAPLQPPSLPASPISPSQSSITKTLAQLPPNAAYGGTAPSLSPSPTTAKKTLLG